MYSINYYCNVQKGQAVLVRALNSSSGQFGWVPGTVLKVNMPVRPPQTPSERLANTRPELDLNQVTYELVMYNGEEVHTFCNMDFIIIHANSKFC